MLLSNQENIKNKNLIFKVKSEIGKNYKNKIKKLKKVEKIYENPKKIPEELKTSVASKIEKKKEYIKEVYHNPKEASNMLKSSLLSASVGAPDNFSWYIIKL